MQEALQHALSRHNAGSLGEAEAVYRQILQAVPNHPETLRLLGVLTLQRGDAAGAVGWLRQAVAADGGSAEIRQTLGLALRRMGRAEEAADSHAIAFALDPRRADALVGVGLVHAQCGRAGQAAAAFRAALALAPADETALFQLGLLPGDTVPATEVAERYRAAIRVSPDTAVFYTNAGLLLRRLGRAEEAERVYRAGLARTPGDTTCLRGLGETLLDRGRPEEAEVWFARAVMSDRGATDARDGLARAFERRFDYPRAEAQFARLVALAPHDARAHYNLGMMHERQGRLVDAVPCYERAWRLDPGFDPPWEKIVQKFTYCDWRHFESDCRALIDRVRRQDRALPPLAFLYLPTTAADQHRCAVNHMREVELKALPAGLRERIRFARRPGPRERLTIGYQSGDFRDHAVAHLIVGLFEEHDRAGFRVFGYSTGPDAAGQPLRRRIEAGFDRMTDIRDLSALDAARRIHEDGVDILVDLSAHTRHARLDVLALRPAPIQLNWLGYPGTSGADFMDGILVDPIVVPPDQQPFYSERLIHLPDCYQPNDRKRPVAAETPTRAACGLPEDGVVFCSFNHAPKILPETFDAWMRILHAVPGSVLWLLHTDDLADRRLAEAAAARGIDPARVVFADRVPLARHLARYRLADLFLDTWPYNAHTTTSDSLWVGCPLVTLMGDTFPARVAASLLTNAGVPELITRSLAEYEALALDLARDPGRRRALRARLEANRDTCPLFDTPRFARNLEAVYRRLWDEHLAGRFGA
ncbi:hypothetical protein TSO221_05315 [Azospirillum sp. TSO22-1]|nr:hypothetical protein TSO221_05315 [Azospirillum sp. TSO22-1]